MKDRVPLICDPVPRPEFPNGIDPEIEHIVALYVFRVISEKEAIRRMQPRQWPDAEFCAA